MESGLVGLVVPMPTLPAADTKNGVGESSVPLALAMSILNVPYVETSVPLTKMRPAPEPSIVMAIRFAALPEFGPYTFTSAVVLRCPVTLTRPLAGASVSAPLLVESSGT